MVKGSASRGDREEDPGPAPRVPARLAADEDQLTQVKAAREYAAAEGQPQGARWAGAEYSFDRKRSFGFKNKLSYHVWVNWMIAEHKSQGAFQLLPFHDDFEKFVGLGPESSLWRSRADALFAAINAP